MTKLSNKREHAHTVSEFVFASMSDHEQMQLTGLLNCLYNSGLVVGVMYLDRTQYYCNVMHDKYDNNSRTADQTA